MRYGFHDISGHQHLKAKQERTTDANLVDLGLLLGYPLPQLAISGPGDAGHDDENAEDLDPATDDPDRVIDYRLKCLERGYIVHDRACPAYAHSSAVPAIRREPAVYFAFTLDVIDVITLDAILNSSLRFLIPCRRAIQSKSV